MFFLLGVAVLGLLSYLFLKNVLHLRLWFIAVLFLGVGLLLRFAVLRMLL